MGSLYDREVVIGTSRYLIYHVNQEARDAAPDVALMLGQRLRRWPNIKLSLGERLVLPATYLPLNQNILTLTTRAEAP